jgi:glycosyltransferase involved in cell wall biosynthesis
VVRISVVICTHTEERWGTLVAAIDSVRRQTLQAEELILVVDHNPGLLERARRELEGVAVTENRAAAGLSGARNSGIALARGEVVAFLDDDAVADPDWLEQLALPYRQPQVIGVGGSIDPDWQPSRPSWFPREFDWVVGCTYQGMPQAAAPVRNLIGANMSFRREAFASAGLFLDTLGRTAQLPEGCEETELSIRINRVHPGSQLIYQPEARVTHLVPAGRATWSYFFRRSFSEGISKAKVARLAGARQGLSSEWAYTLRVLPNGFLDGLRDALKGDLSGLGKSAAIAAGWMVTTAGYLWGALTLRTGSTRQPGTSSLPNNLGKDAL